jgi:trimethylamine--corrinoid protein Co-methyltransferase
MLCLVQAAEPGVPFIYAPIPEIMDPRSGRYAGGAVHSVLGAVTTEMARHYGLAAMGSGSNSDHFVPGMQTGYEKGISSLPSTLAWPDLLCGPGTLGGAMVFGLEQTVIDVEIFRICRKAHDGIVVSEDRWLTDVLERVGPGGQFIGETSTRKNARSGEWFLPQFGVHDSYDAWTAAGRPDLVDEARAQVEEILAHHEPLPLGEDVERALDDLRARAAGA